MAVPEDRMPLTHLLRTADLSATDLRALLDLSHELKREPLLRRDLLAGEAVVMYFAKPSTRTRISFATAIGRLGATPVAVGPAELQLGRGETIEDTAAVISRYARAFVIRTFSDDDVARFAAAATIPVVNALTDGHHPCQSIADLLTIEEALGSLAGRRIAYIGDGNNVTHSLMEAAVLAGATMVVGTPDGYGPDPAVVEHARGIAVDGAEVILTADPHQAAAGADVLYADVWLSMGDPDEERDRRLRDLADYRITGDLLSRAAPGAIFLHCLPAHRGEEVTAEVIDGPQSRVFEQAENRLHTSVAILAALVEGRLDGAGASG
jgi:ornithine carbamoyltransferase